MVTILGDRSFDRLVRLRERLEEEGVKLIRCESCSTPIALLHRWLNCECEQSGGAYLPDGDRCMVAGPCRLYGVSNKVFFGMRTEVWPYDEEALTKRGKPKVTRLAANPGVLPDRLPA